VPLSSQQAKLNQPDELENMRISATHSAQIANLARRVILPHLRQTLVSSITRSLQDAHRLLAALGKTLPLPLV
jgi:hypothetical protein